MSSSCQVHGGLAGAAVADGSGAGFLFFGEEANMGKVVGTLLAFSGITAYTHLKQARARGSRGYVCLCGPDARARRRTSPADGTSASQQRSSPSRQR